ncbi:MAG: sigma-E factor regulatory protein RseB domain-containing protein [Jatrophihabitantaceae bacterium]
MTTVRRWLAVLAATAVLAASPSLVAALPATNSDLSAAELLRLINASASRPYSGYAESTGGLVLPVTDRFGSIADLFGGRSQLRVWHRSSTDWRVDAISFAGETGIHHDGYGDWTWNYESNTVDRTDSSLAADVRFPTEADLLPPELGRRLLSQALPSEATRIGSARVAGRDAQGLRITPDQPASSISHVEVWADPETGLPLRVQVRGKQSRAPTLTSAFLDFSPAEPSAAITAFGPPAGANISNRSSRDLLASIDQWADVAPPDRLAGLERNPRLPTLGSVGVYGRGVTELLAVPLPGRIAFSLSEDLADATGADPDESQLRLSVGPLNLLLSNPSQPDSAWLLIGTVTAATLAAAAAELPAHSEPDR